MNVEEYMWCVLATKGVLKLFHPRIPLVKLNTATLVAKGLR